VPFEFGPKQIASQKDLKQALLASPVLHLINYSSNSPVILAVNTSFIAVSFYLCQVDLNNPKKWYYAHFGSIPLNNREQ
jgi:hypothetical protein